MVASVVSKQSNAAGCVVDLSVPSCHATDNGYMSGMYKPSTMWYRVWLFPCLPRCLVLW